MKEEDSSIVAEYFGFESKWYRGAQGEHIHYIEDGTQNSTPVILLHGSAIGITAAANFFLTIPALVKAGYRVIAPDLHGYGFTLSSASTTGDREDQIDLVLRLMDYLGINSAYMIGNSMGGMILTSLAFSHPDRIIGGIIVGTGGASWPNGSRFISSLSSHKDMGEYSRELVRRSMQHLVYNPNFVSGQLLEVRARIAERPGAYERHKRATQVREESKRKWPFDRARAGESEIPMLFLFGREDRINPPEDALAAAEAFMHADLVVFGHCGHWTMIERAEEFHHFMLRFLSGWDRRLAESGVIAGDPARTTAS